MTDYVEDGAVRLVGGSSVLEGRVELYHDNEWGTVCDNDWDLYDAEVVCRQLGYGRAIQAVSEAYFGAGQECQPIFLDDVHCSGTEEKLVDCKNPSANIYGCSHFEDAGVFCSNAGKRGGGGGEFYTTLYFHVILFVSLSMMIILHVLFVSRN